MTPLAFLPVAAAPLGVPAGSLRLPVLPPLSAASTAPGLLRGQRLGVVAAVLVVHLAAAGWLAQQPVVRNPVVQARPLQVSLWVATATPAVPMLAMPPALPPHRKPVPDPKPQARPPTPLAQPPLLAAAPSPQPSAPTTPAPPAPQVEQPAPAAAAVPNVAVAPSTSAAPSDAAVPKPASAVAPVPAPTAKPATATAPHTLPPGAVQYLQLPDVVYPRLSRRNREAGVVVVRVAIAAQGGAPRELAVHRSSGHPRLDEAALAAVRLARFKPYTENGQPVEAWALVPIEFELEP